LWKYPHTAEDEMLVRRYAASQNLPVFTGRVKLPEFHETMRTVILRVKTSH